MRANTIAVTESAGAVAAGADDAIRQAVERGDVEAGVLEVTWHARNAGPRARPDHQEMDGQVVPFGEDFTLPDGTKMARPHDPRGGAKHNANCGCTSSVSMRLD
jgi:hypothetical protein